MSPGLNLKRYQSFHFHPNPKDYYKPNFIFSSDIIDNVNRLCRVYCSLKPEVDATCQHTCDLAEHVDIEFSVNVELNTLLNRNNNLKPSDLIKDNLVFLAKTNDEDASTDGVSSILKIMFNDDKWAIHPRNIVSNEVFIVTLCLKVLNFIVDSDTVTIDFLKDENYGILLLCDYNFVLQIQNYIQNLFKNDLLVSNLKTDVYDTSIHDINEVNLSQDISGTETTLEISEHEVTDADVTDYSPDMSYTKKEDDDDDLDTLVGRNIKHSLLKPAVNLVSKVQESQVKEDTESFIGNMNNLRHNDSGDLDSQVNKEPVRRSDEEPQPQQTPQEPSRSQLQQDIDAHEQLLREQNDVRPCVPGEAPSLGEPFEHDLFVKPDSKPRTLSSSSTFKSPTLRPVSSKTGLDEMVSPELTSPIEFPRIKLRHSNPFLNQPPPAPTYTEDLTSLSRKSSRGFVQPQPKPIKKSPSYSLDLHEFDTLTPGATFVKGVKGDKKFKFIQVGKVQKFVNLFEERVHEENESISSRTSTRASSRAGTPRAASPVKI